VFLEWTSREEKRGFEHSRFWGLYLAGNLPPMATAAAGRHGNLERYSIALHI
jgi:hypothetical protein